MCWALTGLHLMETSLPLSVTLHTARTVRANGSAAHCLTDPTLISDLSVLRVISYQCSPFLTRGLCFSPFVYLWNRGRSLDTNIYRVMSGYTPDRCTILHYFK